MIQAAIFIIVPLCLAIAALTDLFTMTIPNRVSVILLLAFLLVGPASGMGLVDIGLHLAAGLLVFAIAFLLFSLNTMGGGDAKLLTASAVWFGLNQSLIDYMLLVAFCGGALAVVILLLRRQQGVLAACGLQLPASFDADGKIPYGIAIALGGFLAYPTSPLMLAALGASAG
ncbi:peptidase [Xaviernesmea oryzae]|uniref:Peptidase n=1 Tax=Xaviernesmea oryzae TaxID=464029 RepID=A0A1Q9B2Q5_9HYPH|nr:prepilin peptidase [Xaviernesmea oryzae]OLP62272.1 peptidase [Xaviernesmea oryzae]SEL94095.1 prepilin peptidase CpaA [Xaviernesmea oryzae]